MRGYVFRVPEVAKLAALWNILNADLVKWSTTQLFNEF